MSDTSMFDLTGKVSVVSGAARGMGRSMALSLASAGSDMLLVDLNEKDLKSTMKEIRSMGRKVDYSTTDVSEIDRIPALFEHLDNTFGRVDFLGNVAGGETVFGAPEDISIADFEQSIKSLVTGRFLCARKLERGCLLRVEVRL